MQLLRRLGWDYNRGMRKTEMGLKKVVGRRLLGDERAD